METRLHSYETYLYKYILPIAWIPWDGFGSLRRAFPSSEANSATIIWVGMVVWCLLYLLVAWYALRLKTVFAKETGLRVRGYVSEIEIPFSDVSAVKHNWFMKNDTLWLNVRSEFGERILFIAKRRIVTERGAISTLDMLRKLIAKRDL